MKIEIGMKQICFQQNQWSKQYQPHLNNEIESWLLDRRINYKFKYHHPFWPFLMGGYFIKIKNTDDIMLFKLTWL
jgi:hypothetical protein